MKKQKRFDENNPAQKILNSRIGKVKPIDDDEKYKDAILTEFYNSGILEVKIQSFITRNLHLSKFVEDFKAETFYWLCSKDPDELIELYEDSPSRLVALAVTILKWKCFSKSSKDPDYPKHSLSTQLMYNSNFAIDKESVKDKEIIQPIPDNPMMKVLDVIYHFMEDDDIDFILKFLKNKTNSKKAESRYQELLNKIKYIIDNNDYVKKIIQDNE